MTTLPPDIFGRESVAKTMCELITKLSEQKHSPFVLDGPWGCGKTVHAQRMIEYFQKEQNTKCIYWNASLSDFSQSPLLTFIAELYKHITEDAKKNTFSDICSKLFKGASCILNQLIQYRYGFDTKKTIDETFTDNNSIKRYLLQVFEEREKLETAHNIIELVKGNKQLIIIIDELDRCRPTFALEILENIKHLFESAECKFLLVMNSEALIASISHLYGFDNESAALYLNKYIKTTLVITKIPKAWDGIKNCNSIYFYHLLEKNGISNTVRYRHMQFFTSHLFQSKKMELREIEKFVKRIKLIYDSTERHHAEASFFQLCLAAYLLEFSPITAALLHSLDIEPLRVFDELNCNDKEHYNQDIQETINYVKLMIEYHLKSSKTQDAFSQNRHNQITYNFYKQWEDFCLHLNTGIIFK